MDNEEGCGFAVGNQFRGGEWTLLIAVHDSNGDTSIAIGHEEAPSVARDWLFRVREGV